MPRTDSARKRASARLRRQHAERRASGLCTRCGKAPPEPGLKMCSDCGEKRRAADRARRARARAEGKQYGGRDPDLCRRADRAGDRRRRRARRDAGLCSTCGRNPPEDGRSVCEPCREARRAIDRRRYAARRAAGACVPLRRAGGRRVIALCPARRAGSGTRLARAQESPRPQTLCQAQGAGALHGLRRPSCRRCTLPRLRPAVQYPRACVSRCAGRAALLQRDRAGDPGGSRHLRDRGRSRCLPRLRGAAPPTRWKSAPTCRSSRSRSRPCRRHAAGESGRAQARCAETRGRRPGLPAPARL